MKKLLFLLLGLPAALASVTAAAPPGAHQRKVTEPKWLRQELTRIRAKYRLPALAASFVVGDQMMASAVGQRKLGSPAPVTLNDRFCVGSVSKPMTSTLVGALVEKGVLSFDDTMEKMFPELVRQMRPAYRKVTVRMLLSHTSGLPGGPKKVEPRQPTPDDLNQAMANRYQYVCNAVVDPPEARPGQKNIYGASCVIVVSYLERKLKKPYEELMEQYVFRPLGMTTAGKFCMVSGPDKLDSPWPHDLKDGRYAVPLRIGKGFSRAPAGGVCLSIGDLGKWASAHLQGENGRSNLLRSKTFRELHRLLPGPHATMSFGRQSAGWAGAEVLWHNGGHIGISAVVEIVPAHNYAICVASNCGGEKAGQAQREVRDFLVKRAQAMQKGKRK